MLRLDGDFGGDFWRLWEVISPHIRRGGDARNFLAAAGGPQVIRRDLLSFAA
jgi:hypothetical protein